MTLSLALLTPRFVSAVTDRRLSAGRWISTKEHEKTFGLFTDGARMAVSFAGLAMTNGISIHSYLMKATMEAGAPDFLLPHLLERLQVRLTDLFLSNHSIRSVSPGDRRLSVLFAGYGQGETAFPYCAVLSNWQDLAHGVTYPEAQDGFMLSSKQPGAEPLLVGIGNCNGIDGRDLVSLSDDLDKLNERGATLRLAALICNAADRPGSRHTIGKQLTSLVLSPDFTEGIKTDYHVRESSRALHMPSAVWTGAGVQQFLSGINIRPVGADVPDLVVPRVGPNKPCPCKSGRRYRDCHGGR